MLKKFPTFNHSYYITSYIPEDDMLIVLYDCVLVWDEKSAVACCRFCVATDSPLLRFDAEYVLVPWIGKTLAEDR